MGKSPLPQTGVVPQQELRYICLEFVLAGCTEIRRQAKEFFIPLRNATSTGQGIQRTYCVPGILIQPLLSLTAPLL